MPKQSISAHNISANSAIVQTMTVGDLTITGSSSSSSSNTDETNTLLYSNHDIHKNTSNDWRQLGNPDGIVGGKAA